MNWSSIWPVRWLRAKSTPARRTPFQAQLAVEVLEDRLVPSTTVTNPTYQEWSQQRFTVDDARVATVTAPAAATVSATAENPQNASFGAMIGLPTVFGNYPYRGDGASVAVIDTGIDYNNVNLGGGFGPGHRVIAGWDFVNNDANPMDDNGHGTVVAGIIGSASATYSGVAPNVNLIALKVLDKTGSGTYGAVQSALDWVVANRAKYHIVAINLSLGSGNYTVNPYTFLGANLSSLKSNGVFSAVAAGNSFYSSKSMPGLDYPAIDPNVVSVGAVYDGNFGAVAWGSGARDNTTAVDRIASFSQRSSALSIMAPGAMVTSTYLDNAMQTMAGTSMATPVIAGAAVILRQALDAQNLHADQSTILSLMQRTGVTVVDGDDENDNVTNTGLSFQRLDLGAALNALGKPINLAPVLQPIASQIIAPSVTRTVTISASDPENNALTFKASVVNAPGSQAYQWKQQLGLTYAGSYFTNAWGQNEKSMSSTGSTWYCILPSGELRRWAGSITATLQAANLMTTLDPSYYGDPSLLWNAQPVVSLTVNVAGNQLTIQAPAGALPGSYQIQVTASDGALSSTKTFTLIVQGNTAPQITAFANPALLANRSHTITIGATDAQNDPITFGATIIGTFASRPATLVLVGKQLTIYSAPDFAGGFDVQVTASDGALTSTTTFHVKVAASSVAFRMKGDFNGDGIQDAATYDQDGTIWLSLKKADGRFVNQNWAKWAVAAAWTTVRTGDFNGDGKTDIVGIGKGGYVWVGTSTGTAFSFNRWLVWSPGANWFRLQIGDFNGDGKTDIVGFGNGGYVRVGTSNGSAFTSTLWAKWGAPSGWASLDFADIDGDGKTDLFGQNTKGQWYVGYATGASFRTQLWTSSTSPVGRA